MTVRETPRVKRQLVAFVLVGILNTAFGYAAFAVLLLAGLHYALAAALSTILGILFNFQTIGRLVFGSRDPSLIFRFVGVYGVVYVLNVGALRLFAETSIPTLAAQALLLPAMAAVSFVLNQRFVFARGAREVAGS
jgi:putative flippase GtrA